LKIEIREKNIMAYDDLILAQEDNIAFGLVDEACTEALSEVDEKLAWSKLKSRLKREYGTSCIDDEGMDPDIWISGLEKVRTRLNEDFKLKVSKQDVLIKILNNVPEAYDGTVDLLEKELEKGELELTTLHEKLITKYEKL